MQILLHFQVIKDYLVLSELDFFTAAEKSVEKLQPMNLGGGTVIDVTEGEFEFRRCSCKI